MLKNTVTRRTFIQYLTGSVTAILLPQSLLAEHPATIPVTPPHQHDNQSEFIIVNGWVLLKKDLEQ